MSVLEDLVTDFARGIQAVVLQAPVASNSRTVPPTSPGSATHRGPDDKLVMAYLADADPRRYAATVGCLTPTAPGQAWNMLDGPEPWEWAVEVKMLRLMGDNGKLNDSTVMYFARPPLAPSAPTDCAKLGRRSSERRRRSSSTATTTPAGRWTGHRGVPVFARQQVLLAQFAVRSPTLSIQYRRGRVFRWQFSRSMTGDGDVALAKLRDGPLYRFADWPNPEVPNGRTGVYTVWVVMSSSTWGWEGGQ